MTIEFPLRKTNQVKHSVEQLRQRPPADIADSVAIPVSRLNDRKENRPPMEATSSSTPGPQQRVSHGQYQQSSTVTEEDEGQSTRKVDPKRQRHKNRIKRRKEAENTSSEGAQSQPAGPQGAAVLATTTNTKPANNAPVKPAGTQPAEDLASGTNAGSARDALTKSAGTQPTKFQSSVSAEDFPSKPLEANRSTGYPSSITPGTASRRSSLYDILQKSRGSKAEPEKKIVVSLPSTHTQEAGKSVASPSQLGTLMVEPVAELMARGDSSSSHEVPMTDHSQIVSTMPTTHDPSEISETENDHVRNRDSSLIGHPNDSSPQQLYGTTEDHHQAVEHEVADTAALARRNNEAADITPRAKHHEPRTRKPVNIMVPAVPDMHKLNQLLMKQKQTEQSNVGVTSAQEARASGDCDEAGDSTPVSKDSGPSYATAVFKSQEVTVPRFDKPAVSAPKELSQPDLPARKSSVRQTSVPVDTRRPPLRMGLAVRTTENPSYDPAKLAFSTSNTFTHLQDFMNEDQAGSPSCESKTLTPRSPTPEYSTPPENSPTKQVMDNVDETWSQTVAEATSSSQRKTSKHSQGDDEIYQDNSPPTADQRHESPGDVTAADPTVQSIEQIPVIHDSVDPAAQTAEVGSVPAKDDSGQPGEQDVTRDNTSGMIRSVSFDKAPDTNILCPAAVASKAAKNKKKNLKRKEKKEREKRQADQEVNSGSDTIASSSTAYGARAISYRSEGPFDFHAPVALQPGQVSNQPTANSLSQMAHEYHGTFGNFSPSHMLNHKYEDHR